MTRRQPPLADVVIPVLNRETTIGRTVQSVLSQTCSDLRLWVVDDGSTDETPDILCSIDDDRLTVLRRDHAGPAAARNAGARAGVATNLAFVDSDDVVHSDWLATLLETDRRAGLIRCAGTAYQSGVRSHELRPEERTLLPGLFLVRRSLFEEVGGYDERFRFSENTDLQFRLEHAAQLRGLPIVQIDAVLVDVHMTSDGRSNAAEPARLRDAAELFIEKHGTRLSENPATLASFHAIAGYNSLLLGERTRARSHLAIALALSPRRLKTRLRLWQTYLPRRRAARVQ